MRILQIRFKNLNSLVGEWSIDLTHTAFIYDGIFAITGPTGAGKSTILDAICLALYGRTPRLNKITKSANEIMSRQTGECFAEVTFKTHKGRFRCHWSQHRARKKPEGELQNPKHEIADADTGQIVEAKLKGAADKIESATGMDFERFTRSMLLAQGGFAAFLQAAPDDRAPILEQITGTEIYSHISIRVHERRVQERKTLDLLNAEFEGMQVLAKEDETILKESLAEKTSRETLLGAELNEKNTAIQWLQNIDNLEKARVKIQDEKSVLYDRLHAFAAEQSRLNLANLALELASDYTSLLSSRKQLCEGKTALEQYRNDLPALVHTNNAAIKSAELVERVCAEAKLELQKNGPLINIVRELNVTIVERKKALEIVKTDVLALTDVVGKVNAELNNDEQKQKSSLLTLATLKQQLDTCENDKILVEQLAGLNSRFQNLKAMVSLRSRKNSELLLAKKACAAAQNTLDAETRKVDESARALRSIEFEGQHKSALLSELLEQKEMRYWRDKEVSIREQNSVVATVLAAIEVKTSTDKEQQSIAFDIQRCDSQKTELNRNLVSELERNIALEKEKELLLNQRVLLRRVEELETFRHQLTDDEPCPLCGAEQHPYAKGNVPSVDDTQQELLAANQRYGQSCENISQLKLAIVRLEKDEQQLAVSLEKCILQAKESAGVIAENCTRINSNLVDDFNSLLDYEQLKSTLQKYKKNNEQKTIEICQKLTLAESLDIERQALRESFLSVREHVAESEKIQNNAESAKQRAVEALQRNQRELNDCENQQQALLASLDQEVKPFGIQDLSVENIDNTISYLTARRDTWVLLNTQKYELEKAVEKLAINIEHAAVTLEKEQLNLEALRKNQVAIVQDISVLLDKRVEIFGDKNVDQEELRLVNAVDQAEAAEKVARDAVLKTREALLVLNNKIHDLENSCLSLAPVLEKSTTDFQLKLQQSGFSDESHYASAVLSEEERKQLAEASQALDRQKAEIDIKFRENRAALDIEESKKITDQPIADLKYLCQELLGNQRKLQQDIGGITTKLFENNRLKESQKLKVAAIEAQRIEIIRWDLLHELIGSADGKKYRNFAQGLTFEMMVGHANQQLKKMTDRYLLVRDEAQPLELNVIDNYQAGEVRSTKNLSGGESFIVSLSLALGLSCMASKNVMVDSLFLDEGFGTLDEDALETALETLAGLQQEGKLIGVISHVGALKERIGTQIQVNPMLGGKSGISGPGCRRHE